MGRKFSKSNRHKKLKAVDPFYTGDRKLLIDKGLIRANQPPKANDDDEKIPMKLREYFELNERLKQKKRDTKENPKNKKEKKRLDRKLLHEIINKPDDRGAEVPLRKTKKLEQLKNESNAAYLNRMEMEAQTVINRSQYESQFDVKLETQDEKLVVKKEKKMSERKRKQLNKLKDKLKTKKNNTKEKLQENRKDTVRFGEVASQPPIFTALPKKKVKNKGKFTIPPHSNANGITERDRNEVIQRYRIMKSHGKFQ